MPEEEIRIDGKVAIVTGGARGIGRAIALALAKAGARVVINDIGVSLEGTDPSPAPADEVVAEIRNSGGEAATCFESVTTVAGGAKIINSAVDAFGQFDILVAAAGIMLPNTIFDMTEDEWDRIIETNLKGHFTVMQAAARVIREQKSGTLLALTSSGGLEGNPLQPNYSAAKEGIIGLTRAVALSIAPYATCNAISPSGRSRMTDRLPRAAGVPADASLVAPLAVFLASERARHITGQVITIGGERVGSYPQPRPYQVAFRAGGWTPEQLATQWSSQFTVDKLVRYDRYMKQTDAS